MADQAGHRAALQHEEETVAGLTDLTKICLISCTFIQVSSSLETDSDWAVSDSTALCPGEAARVSSFSWRQERLDIVCT